MSDVCLESWIDAMVDFDLDAKLLKHKIISSKFLKSIRLPKEYKTLFKVNDYVWYKKDHTSTVQFAKVIEIDIHEYAPQLSPEYKLLAEKDGIWIDIGYVHSLNVKPMGYNKEWQIDTNAKIASLLERAKVIYISQYINFVLYNRFERRLYFLQY